MISREFAITIIFVRWMRYSMERHWTRLCVRLNVYLVNIIIIIIIIVVVVVVVNT